MAKGSATSTSCSPAWAHLKCGETVGVSRKVTVARVTVFEYMVCGIHVQGKSALKFFVEQLLAQERSEQRDRLRVCNFQVQRSAK